MSRVSIVTGSAGGGLGQAVARRLAAAGDTVVVTDAHERRTHEVTAAIAADYPHSTIVGFALDVGNRNEIGEVVGQVLTTYGPVGLLVNNAAIDIPGTMFEYDVDDWDRTVAVNLTGPWYLCRLLMPAMRDAGGGVVINIGSMASELGGSGIESPYAVTKGGLHALTRAVARDGGEFGIRAVTLSCSLISDSRFVLAHPELLEMSDVKTLVGSSPTAAELADAVAFLASDSARHITGTALNVNGGAYMHP